MQRKLRSRSLDSGDRCHADVFDYIAAGDDQDAATSFAALRNIDGETVSLMPTDGEGGESLNPKSFKSAQSCRIPWPSPSRPRNEGQDQVRVVAAAGQDGVLASEALRVPVLRVGVEERS